MLAFTTRSRARCKFTQNGRGDRCIALVYTRVSDWIASFSQTALHLQLSSQPSIPFPVLPGLTEIQKHNLFLSWPASQTHNTTMPCPRNRSPSPVPSCCAKHQIQPHTNKHAESTHLPDLIPLEFINPHIYLRRSSLPIMPRCSKEVSAFPPASSSSSSSTSTFLQPNSPATVRTGESQPRCRGPTVEYTYRCQVVSSSFEVKWSEQTALQNLR